MRLRHKPWAKEVLASHPDLVKADPQRQRGQWSEVFGNSNPIHIEVGTGKGRYLTHMCDLYPDINFIGIEKYESVLVTGIQRVEEDKPSNLRFIHGDVHDLESFFAEEEVSRIYINFTDPWPKNRHEKRRLTYKDFLNKYKKVLKKDGDIHMKTDNQGLFEYSLQSFSEQQFTLRNISLDLHHSDIENLVMTEYEEKFSKKGQPIYRLEALVPQ